MKYLSKYNLNCHWRVNVTLRDLCHLGKCGWAETRHFGRKALRFLFTLSCPRFLRRAVQEFQCPWFWVSELEVLWQYLWREKQHPSQGCPQPEPHLHSGFVLSSPAALCHCVTQSTVVHSRVWCLHCPFLQVEGPVTLNKSGLKTFTLWLRVWHRALQEELRSFVEMLDIPEKIGSWISSLVSAVQGHESPLWDSYWAFCLVHWVTIGPSWKRITSLR